MAIGMYKIKLATSPDLHVWTMDGQDAVCDRHTLLVRIHTAIAIVERALWSCSSEEVSVSYHVLSNKTQIFKSNRTVVAYFHSEQKI